MRYLSIDTETTGVDQQRHQVLEIGAIVEDTDNLLDYNEIPKKNIILSYPEYLGSAFAISLNSRIFDILKEYEKISGSPQKVIEFQKEIGSVICPYNEAHLHLHDFLMKHYLTQEEQLEIKQMYTDGPVPRFHKVHVNQAGKNVGTFDVPFLKRLPNFKEIMEFSIRSIDPANYLVLPADKELPGTTACMQRAGIYRNFKHQALSDAWDVIEMLRFSAKGKLYR